MTDANQSKPIQQVALWELAAALCLGWILREAPASDPWAVRFVTNACFFLLAYPLFMFLRHGEALGLVRFLLIPLGFLLRIGLVVSAYFCQKYPSAHYKLPLLVFSGNRDPEPHVQASPRPGIAFRAFVRRLDRALVGHGRQTPGERRRVPVDTHDVFRRRDRFRPRKRDGTDSGGEFSRPSPTFMDHGCFDPFFRDPWRLDRENRREKPRKRSVLITHLSATPR